MKDRPEGYIYGEPIGLETMLNKWLGVNGYSDPGRKSLDDVQVLYRKSALLSQRNRPSVMCYSNFVIGISNTFVSNYNAIGVSMGALRYFASTGSQWGLLRNYIITAVDLYNISYSKIPAKIFAYKDDTCPYPVYNDYIASVGTGYGVLF